MYVFYTKRFSILNYMTALRGTAVVIMINKSYFEKNIWKQPKYNEKPYIPSKPSSFLLFSHSLTSHAGRGLAGGQQDNEQQENVTQRLGSWETSGVVGKLCHCSHRAAGSPPSLLRWAPNTAEEEKVGTTTTATKGTCLNVMEQSLLPLIFSAYWVR